MDPIVAIYVQELQTKTNDQIAEELYGCRQDAKNLPKVGGLSADTLRALEWTKEKIPLLEAEVLRRGMTLPHWV